MVTTEVPARRDGIRPVTAHVDLTAVTHNTGLMAARCAPGSLCAVVKANGYGHGMVEVAGAAIAGGATWLAVAMVEEGAVLRDADFGQPVLLLSEPPPEAMAEVAGLGLTPTVYTHEGVAALAQAVARTERSEPYPVHLKVDTGMHRVGALPADAVSVAVAVHERPELRLEGLWTHFAVADDPEDGFTAEQAKRFAATAAALSDLGLRPPVVHVCNSAAVLGPLPLHYRMARCGITLYGVPPSRAFDGRVPLRPALSLRGRVSLVKDLPAGEAVSYGLRYRCDGVSRIATVPVGYGDGVPWRLGATGGQVLIGGRRRPIAGRVTMDQILVDCGADRSVRAGDEVVLLGTQGDERIDAWDWADWVGTIAYEIVCAIGPRVPRAYLR